MNVIGRPVFISNPATLLTTFSQTRRYKLEILFIFLSNVDALCALQRKPESVN